MQGMSGNKCRRAPGEKRIAYLRNINRFYVRMLKEDKGTMDNCPERLFASTNK